MLMLLLQSCSRYSLAWFCLVVQDEKLCGKHFNHFEQVFVAVCEEVLKICIEKFTL